MTQGQTSLNTQARDGIDEIQAVLAYQIDAIINSIDRGIKGKSAQGLAQSLGWIEEKINDVERKLEAMTAQA